MLARILAEDRVFRAAVMSIALALAVGQDVSLLCGTWCRDAAPAADGCDHPKPAPSSEITENAGCDTVVLEATFIKEDLRRDTPPTNPQHAATVYCYQFVPVKTGDHPDQEAMRLRSRDNGPLNISLRL